ncbi:MAG: ATP-dependent metallopeptidase FtsH/Yme1/Tma family protein, partial [Tannerellaceae bacterium]
MENKPTINPNKKPGMKVNLYWLYSIIAIALVALYYMNDESMTKDVNWTEFSDIAVKGGIKEVTVYTNKDYLDAVLTDSVAEKVFERSIDKIGKNPKVHVNISSAD